MLRDIIEEMEDLPEYFFFYEQENSNYDKVFTEKLNCKFIPNQILEFYKEWDGITFSSSEVFSLDEIQIEMFDAFSDFLDEMGYDNFDKYIPIADDGLDGFYAFKSNVEEETIYHLSRENTKNIDEYDSFEELLEELFNSEVEEDFDNDDEI